MFENQTYPIILQRMEDRVAEKYPNLDLREGSIIFNALAPAAMELAIAYDALENVLKESFVDTASRAYLLLACTQMGIDINQFEATHSTHKLRFNETVPIGSRWNHDIYNYEIIGDLGTEDSYNVYVGRCETAGSEPNGITGQLTPIDYTTNTLTVAEIVEDIALGEEEATDDEIREIYKEYVNDSLVDGNKAQYEHWASEYDGIGRCKVFPLWNGQNTVKVSILDIMGDPATPELVAEFQNYLDPGTKGMGDGVAPIGAFVTVSTATNKTIDVVCDLVIKEGYTETDGIEENLHYYLRDLGYVKSTVSYMSIGANILSNPEVEAIASLRINGSTADIVLGEEQVPILGTATWNIVG